MKASVFAGAFFRLNAASLPPLTVSLPVAASVNQDSLRTFAALVLQCPLTNVARHSQPTDKAQSHPRQKWLDANRQFATCEGTAGTVSRVKTLPQFIFLPSTNVLA